MGEEYSAAMSPGDSISVGVGAVVFKGDEVLLVKRGKAPFKGNWSIPGGGLHHGERIEDAIRREVREETGLEVRLIGLIGVFEALPPEADGGHVVLVDYAAEWVSGEPVAGDDAEAAVFVPMEEGLQRLSWDKTRQAVARAVEIRRAAAKPL
jgi:8-oxo-dGTP diphosphatase